MQEAALVCVSASCVIMCVCGVCVIDSDSVFLLSRLPPGMIINPIIKHLLPTAPALSLSAEALGDSITRFQEARVGRVEGGSERERGKG